MLILTFIFANLLMLAGFARMLHLFFAERRFFDSLGGYVLFLLFSASAYMVYENWLSVLWVGFLVILVVVLGSNVSALKIIAATTAIFAAMVASRFAAAQPAHTFGYPPDYAAAAEYTLAAVIFGFVANSCAVGAYIKKRGPAWPFVAAVHVFFGLLLALLVFFVFGVPHMHEMMVGAGGLGLLGGCALLGFLPDALLAGYEKMLAAKQTTLAAAHQSYITDLNLAHNNELIDLRTHIQQDLRAAAKLLKDWRLDDAEKAMDRLLEKLED